MLASQAETEILKRVIRPELGDITPEVAQAFLNLQFSEADHDRMAELSQRAKAGALSAAEQDELDGYINVSHFIAFLQSKARISLRKPSAA